MEHKDEDGPHLVQDKQDLMQARGQQGQSHETCMLHMQSPSMNVEHGVDRHLLPPPSLRDCQYIAVCSLDLSVLLPRQLRLVDNEPSADDD